MYIYKITNKINNKIYIGQTTQDPLVRFEQHCKFGNRSKIGKAIQKFGKDNFTFEVIKKCESLKELDNSEVEHIAKYNSLAPNGYNVSPGGQYYFRPDGMVDASEEFYLLRAKVRFNSSVYGSGIISGKRRASQIKRSKMIIGKIMSSPLRTKKEAVKKVVDIYKRTGIAIYGYKIEYLKDSGSRNTKRICVDPYQQKVISIIQRLHLLGYTDSEIAKYLSYSLVPTRVGHIKWKPSNIKDIVKSNPISKYDIEKLLKMRKEIDNPSIPKPDIPKIKLIRFLFFMGLSHKRIANELNMMGVPTIGSPDGVWDKVKIEKIMDEYPLVGLKMPDMTLFNEINKDFCQ